MSAETKSGRPKTSLVERLALRQVDDELPEIAGVAETTTEGIRCTHVCFLLNRVVSKALQRVGLPIGKFMLTGRESSSNEVTFPSIWLSFHS